MASGLMTLLFWICAEAGAADAPAVGQGVEPAIPSADKTVVTAPEKKAYADVTAEPVGLTPATGVADGFYRAGADGKKVVAQDGVSVAVGAVLAWSPLKVQLTSCDNENQHFSLSLTLPYDKEFEKSSYLLVCGGIVYRNCGSGHSGTESCDAGFQIEGRENAEAVGRFVRSQPVLRVHPGYQMSVCFAPAKQEFLPGEKVEVVLRICNVGKASFAFQVGGRQRGARDNQFDFTLRGPGGAVPDSGDSMHFGGMGYSKELKPGESFELPVDLSRWFALNEPGFYEGRGSYVLTFHSLPKGGRSDYDDLWSDFATGEFHFRVAEPKKGPEGKLAVEQPLLRGCKSNIGMPEALYQTYARFVAAATDHDSSNELYGLCLRGMKFSYEERPVATRNIGNDLNLPFLKNGFRGEARYVSAGADDCYHIITATSALTFVQTASGRWKLAAYEDRPAE